ncbi:MAG: serine/threonine-protein kinase [Deltaproteobacteria bacterium]|nr:serine/threonine-protein kinase [Deltaproteobacteria bacterium]
MSDEQPLDPLAGTPLPSQHAEVGVETRRLQQAIATSLFGDAAPADPVQIGRFAITERLGSGGMGVVYLAHDPRLERPVALKVMRKDLQHAARDRMVREGRSLARLDHPNVVPVYDVGFVDGRVFVAMGYVRGQTLREWMAANPCRSRRNVDDTVALFQRAGAGLAHAHTEGMVHRDFKPDNALVGEDDAVRVVDFGLAAPAPGPSDPTGVGLTLDSRQQTLPGNESELSESRLTGDGEVVGTPAYMSPEQLLAQPADHRSDQYSFCVALYEALHGERPFGGKTMLALRNQVLIGDRPSTPNAVVPRWINDAVLRGLSREPAERFESMDALLQCLADDPAVRQRRRVTRVAAFVGVVGVAGFAYAQGRREEAIEPCPIVEDASVGGWDEPGRTAVRETLLQGDAPYREQTWATVETNLDEYARQWTAMQHDNCLATRVRVEQSEQLFDMRQGCLADRERSLRAVVEVLGSGNPDVVLRAATVSQGLPSLSVCAWSPAFVSPAPIPQDPELAEQVEQVRERLARAEATGRAGLYTAGLEQARAVATDAASIDFDPLRVEIEERIATAEYRLGQYDAAESRLDDVFWLALSAKHDRVLAAVAVHRVDVSVQRADGDQSDEWERRARAALARIGGDTMLEAALEGALGQRANDESRTADAIEHKRKAVELSRQAESPDPGFTADLLSSYASTMMRQGQIDESIPIYREAIDLLDGIVGPHHPSLASVHNNLGIALLTNGDPEAALEQLLTALEVYREVYPKGHIELANTLAVLGYIHNDRGHLDEAATFLLEALAMFREVMGPDHPKVG